MTRLLIKNARIVMLDRVVENGAILLDGHMIADILPANQTGTITADTQVDANGAWAVPGLIDTHIHGFGGFGPEQGTPEALLNMSLALARQGISAFCPTLYATHPSKLTQLLHTLVTAIGHERGAQILGFHLEGPFISPAKPGAMKPQDIVSPDVKIMQELYEAAQGKITAVTLAPELENIAPVVQFCLQHHIVAQAGHTNATYDEFCRGIDMGITHVTHAFNAMRAFNHREPGAAGGVLMRQDVSCEFIGDGVHVHPQIISFLRHVKSEDKLVLITDALTPTAQPNGPFIANGDQVVFEGGVWRRASDKVITGSALTLPQGIKNLVAWGYSLPQAVRCATANPAARLQVKNRGQLARGFQADILLLNQDIVPLHLFIQGRQIL